MNKVLPCHPLGPRGLLIYSFEVYTSFDPRFHAVLTWGIGVDLSRWYHTFKRSTLGGKRTNWWQDFMYRIASLLSPVEGLSCYPLAPRDVFLFSYTHSPTLVAI